MTAEPEPLDERAINRALLSRQCLLDRADLPLPRMLDRIGGIQAQYAPSMYVGVWSRLNGFARDDLTRALEDRTVVQGTLLRSTIHLVSAEDYWPFAVGVRDARRAMLLRISGGRPSARELERAAERLAVALADGPMRQKDIDTLLGPELRRAVGSWLDLVRVPPSGTWTRRRADLFTTAESWLGPPRVDVLTAQEILVRRYLGGFGPSTRAEIANWAGLAVETVSSALERLDVRRLWSTDGAELVDLPGPAGDEVPSVDTTSHDASLALLPDPATPAPVRFLPTWDATLLVHARRSQILPERHRPRIFSTKLPASLPTFLVDGQVAGTWRFRDDAISVEEFEPLGPSARRAVTDEGERLTELFR